MISALEGSWWYFAEDYPIFFPSTCSKIVAYGVFLYLPAIFHRQNLIIHEYGENERVRNGGRGIERIFTLSTVCKYAKNSVTYVPQSWKIIGWDRLKGLICLFLFIYKQLKSLIDRWLLTMFMCCNDYIIIDKVLLRGCKGHTCWPCTCSRSSSFLDVSILTPVWWICRGADRSFSL